MERPNEIREARALLERAEKEVDPNIKMKYLEEGLGLLSELQEEPNIDQSFIDKIKNIRLAHVRSLLTQLCTINSEDKEIWAKYGLFLISDPNVKDTVKSLLEKEPELKNKLLDFLGAHSKASIKDIEKLWQ